MKKLIICLALSILFSCKDNTCITPYSPNELEFFDGYVLIGKTESKDKSRLCFILKEPATDKQYPRDVSEKTYNSYKLGDTIHWKNPEQINNIMPTDTCEFSTIINKNGHEYIFTVKHSDACPCKQK